MKITVLGAGAWGTALALALTRQHELRLWARDASLCAQLATARENPRYLPGHALPAGLAIEADFARAVQGAELLLIATPLAGLRPTLARLQALPLPAATPLLWLCKGLEVGTGLLPHQIAAEILPAHIACGALTGPSFADEVARGLPTAITLASRDVDFARRCADALSDAQLRVYAGDDLIGAEVGGAVKNALAIASGISDGLGLGHNSRAALITRGLAEVTRLALALGARQETLMGLTGMGDLILTCTGDLSRNRRVGLALARGQSLDDSVRELGHVAEGVPTARAVAQRARELGVDMPIVTAVCAVLDGRLTAAAAVGQLMARAPRSEWEA